jgi:hypothetical protein
MTAGQSTNVSVFDTLLAIVNRCSLLVDLAICETLIRGRRAVAFSGDRAIVVQKG